MKNTMKILVLTTLMTFSAVAHSTETKTVNWTLDNGTGHVIDNQDGTVVGAWSVHYNRDARDVIVSFQIEIVAVNGVHLTMISHYAPPERNPSEYAIPVLAKDDSIWEPLQPGYLIAYPNNNFNFRLTMFRR